MRIVTLLYSMLLLSSLSFGQDWRGVPGHCPYGCGPDGKRLGNRFGNPELCCFDLGEAVAGVLARMEIQRQIDQAARIAENADRLKECGVSVN